MLLHDFFYAAVARLPNKTALICDGQRYTYSDLAVRVNILAHTLRTNGVKRGDRVALFLDNSVEMAVGVYATLTLGAVFMPVNALTKQDKLAYLLNDSRAAALVTDIALENIWVDALAENKSVIAAIVVNGVTENFAASVASRCVPYPTDLVTERVAEPATIDCDLASIIYTSGSTGEPQRRDVDAFEYGVGDALG